MKVRVGVFFGGNSVEHEVSIISGIQAIHAFNKDKYEIVPVYISRDGRMYTGNKVADIKEYTNIPSLIKKSIRVLLVKSAKNYELVKHPFSRFGKNRVDTIDVAFPVVHGTNVEDGSLQGYFRTIGIPFAGCDVTASAVGMDKYITKTVLKDHHIPVLDCSVISSREFSTRQEETIRMIEDTYAYPVIVKPINLGSSVGIRIARSHDDLADALEFALEFASSVLVEKALVHMREINCSVLGNAEDAEASECEEPVGADEILSYQDKYASGSSAKDGVKGTGEGARSNGMSGLTRKLPADLTPENRQMIREMAVATFKALRCEGVSRIDFLEDLSDHSIYVNEINTIPGSLAFYLWEPLGMHYDALLDRMVQLAFQRSRENQNLSFSFETHILAGADLSGSKGNKSARS